MNRGNQSRWALGLLNLGHCWGRRQQFLPPCHHWHVARLSLRSHVFLTASGMSVQLCRHI
jgi:hypothetical protein